MSEVYSFAPVGGTLLSLFTVLLFIGLFVLSIVALVLVIRFLLVAVRVMTKYERKHLLYDMPPQRPREVDPAGE